MRLLCISKLPRPSSTSGCKLFLDSAILDVCLVFGLHMGVESGVREVDFVQSGMAQVKFLPS